MLDDEQSDIPFHYFLASAFLVRLDQDEDFDSAWSSGTMKDYRERLAGKKINREAVAQACQPYPGSRELPEESAIDGAPIRSPT